MAKEMKKGALIVLNIVAERKMRESIEKEDYLRAAMLSIINEIGKEVLRELQKEE